MNVNDENKTAEDYDKEGKEALNKTDYKGACDLFKKAREIFIQRKDKQNAAFQNFNIAYCYQSTGILDKAIEAYETCYELIKTDLTLSEQHPIILNNTGHLYVTTKNYDKAISCFNNAADHFESLGNEFGKALQLQNIGSVYRDSNQSEKALESYFASIAIFEQLDQKIHIADQCTNIAYIYSVDKKTDDALKWYEKALKLYEEIKDENKAAFTRQNIDYLKKQL